MMQVEVNIEEDPWYGIATDYDNALGSAPFSPWKPDPNESPVEEEKKLPRAGKARGEQA